MTNTQHKIKALRDSGRFFKMKWNGMFVMDHFRCVCTDLSLDYTVSQETGRQEGDEEKQ